jgi:hypothetical protein
MKIFSIAVETELGRRMVKLSAPLDVDVDAGGDMPPKFRSLTEVLWGLVREIASQSPDPTTPKAEA